MNVSVVICTYNRAKQLQPVLGQLERQIKEMPSGEVIVVDNNSNDQTREVVAEFLNKEASRFAYYFEPRQGISVARNLGWRLAKGNIVIFTDDDVRLADNWLKNIVKTFETYQCDALGGRVLPAFPPNTPHWVKNYIDILRGPFPKHDYGEDTRPYDPKTMDPFLGANMAFRRESVLDKNILFDENIGAGTMTLGEDTDAYLKLMKEGKKVFYCGEAMLWHPVVSKRMSLGFLARWYAASGRYKIARDKGQIEKGLVCYFGIPRYLFKELMACLINLILALTDQRKFLLAWEKYFRKWGIIQQYSQYYKASRSKNHGCNIRKKYSRCSD